MAGRYVPRAEPGAFPAGVLAVLVHVLLAGALIFGLRWQNKPPEAVNLELWNAPPAPVPRVETAPKPEPAPVVKPEPKPEPKVEPPPPPPREAAKPAPPPKPDIALEREKERKAKEERELKERAEKERVEKDRAEKARREADAKAERERIDRNLKQELANDRDRLMKEAIAREQADLKKAQADEQAKRDAEARAAAAVQNKARDAWIAAIQGKVRGNVVLPDGITGNPVAVLRIVQLPTGDVVDVTLVQSSGNPAYDQAVDRAIRRSSPLPQPSSPELFQRELTLRFRPLQ